MGGAGGPESPPAFNRGAEFTSAPREDQAWPGLALQTQRRLESFYALEPSAPVTDFLLSAEEAARYPGGGSRVLVSEDGEGLAVAVVFEPEVTAQLAEADPRQRLDQENLGAFCTLTEEVSHFVYLLFRARISRSVTQLELELQGEVDKYLSAAFLLSLQNEGAVSRHLRELLFRRYRLAEGLSAEQAERYHAASALADRYCGWLEARFLRPARLEDLARESRRFYRLGQRDKLERIALMASS
jgi:hypothetical protein